MSAPISPVESFLTEFHDSRPGLTTKAFGALPVAFRGQVFASSYHVLAALVSPAKSATEVLDIACGDGFLLSLLAARGQPGLVLSGIDMSSSELGAARMHLASSVNLQQARAQELPFTSGRFDYVLCHLALMLMDDAEVVLREVRRVLKVGGTFAAIVSARPPPSVAFETWVKVLSRHARRADLAGIQFGDRRFRDREGTSQILSLAFQDVSIEDITVRRRLTPRELWLWFFDMYDLYLLNEGSRGTVEEEYLAAIAPHCDQDGKLEYATTLRYVCAAAA